LPSNIRNPTRIFDPGRPVHTGHLACHLQGISIPALGSLIVRRRVPQPRLSQRAEAPTRHRAGESRNDTARRRAGRPRYTGPRLAAAWAEAASTPASESPACSACGLRSSAQARCLRTDDPPSSVGKSRTPLGSSGATQTKPKPSTTTKGHADQRPNPENSGTARMLTQDPPNVCTSRLRPPSSCRRNRNVLGLYFLWSAQSAGGSASVA